MNSASEVLAKLGALTEADRLWILAQLPASAKARLLDDPSALHALPVVPDLNESEEHSIHRALAKAEPERVLRVLEREPTWLIVAVLGVRDWPWRAAVLEGLPESQRVDVSRVSSISAFTVHTLDALCRALLRKVSDAEPSQPESKFSQLVAKLSSSRSRRRLTLHL
jgi:hypothetical protein